MNLEPQLLGQNGQEVLNGQTLSTDEDHVIEKKLPNGPCGENTKLHLATVYCVLLVCSSHSDHLLLPMLPVRLENTIIN